MFCFAFYWDHNLVCPMGIRTQIEFVNWDLDPGSCFCHVWIHSFWSIAVWSKYSQLWNNNTVLTKKVPCKDCLHPSNCQHPLTNTPQNTNQFICPTHVIIIHDVLYLHMICHQLGVYSQFDTSSYSFQLCWCRSGYSYQPKWGQSLHTHQCL